MSKAEARKRVARNWRVKGFNFRLLYDGEQIRDGEQFEAVSHAGGKTLAFFRLKNGRIKDITI